MERKGRVDAVAFALAHIRASTGREMTRQAFEAALASGVCDEASRTSIEDHLREAQPAELADLVAEGSATFESLAALAAQVLEPGHCNAVFLAEAIA